jgi:hypothetical protein
MFGLEIILPNWLAALILGVLLVVCAAIGIVMGQRRLKTIRVHRKTIQTVKENLEWIKEQQGS